MRAYVLEKAEGKQGQVYHPASIKDVDIPQLSEGQALVKIAFAALNHRDLFIRRSLYSGVTFPSILGADGVGTVIEPKDHPLHGKPVLLYPAENWTSSKEGPDNPQRPFGILGGVKETAGRGTFADYIAIASDHLVELPPHLHSRLDAAAAFPLGGLTAYRATFIKAHVEQGQNVLITGIGGGVALQALQYCVAQGANVWVTSGTQEKIEKAKAIGAEGGVIYTDDDWHKQLQNILPKDRPQLDAVIDAAGGDIVGKTVRMLKHGGIIACYGSCVSGLVKGAWISRLTEDSTTLQNMPISMPAILKNIEFKGSTMGSLEEFKQAVRFIDQHKIVPVVHTVLPSLENAEEGFQMMDKGSQFGKIVIHVAGDQAEKGKL